ncbi:MAG: succinylglutamate desuccinylase/aspartoacylase family protein [Alphaproteobacteria bacterium]|nr:succinylglutamate desuccinylase/aspartoacylase family protein [Alphaproteobacteria bacterium]
MAETEHHRLREVSLGDQRSLTIHRFGQPGARPKVYVQAGIHANELAAPLTAHHLADRLKAADEAGQVVGEILVVPIANPIGLSQVQSGEHFGRHDLETGGNYNRAFFDVSEAVLQAVMGRLGSDAAENTRSVRSAVLNALNDVTPRFAIDDLHIELQKRACDADIVLDLHTDSDAEMHLFLDPTQWPAAEDLASELGVEVVMLARASGSNPFEETIAAPYVAVHEAHGEDHPIDVPLTVVVELRGLADVSDELAGQDADALMRFLQRRGCLAGDPGAQPPFTGVAAPFEQTTFLWATAPGIVAFKKPLGAMVAAGDVVAEIIDVSAMATDGARTPVLAETSGKFFARSLTKLARPGQDIGKIFGTTPVEGRVGDLLSD